MHFIRRVFIFLLLLSPGLFVHAKEVLDTIVKPDSSQMNRKAFYRAVAFTGTYYAGSMIIMQNTWYRDREVVPFHFFNDNKGYLQVDKFGHTFGPLLNYHSPPSNIIQKENSGDTGCIIELFIIPKFRALGAIIIFPVMVGILLTHLFIEPSGLPISLVLLAINLWIIFGNREKYMPMIRYRGL